MVHTRRPLVTVLMPTLNSGRHLSEAIESILSQSMDDLHLVILDGGSTDATLPIARHFTRADKRVRVHLLPGLNPAARMDVCFQESRSKYVAIQHSDDVSYTARLARQLALHDAEPDIVISSAGYRSFWHERTHPPQHEGTTRHHKPTDHESIKAQLPFWWVMHVPTLMIDQQRAMAQSLQFANRFIYLNDYCQTLGNIGKLRYGNLDEELSAYRLHSHSDGVTNGRKVLQETRSIKALALKTFGFAFTPQQLKIHRAIRIYPDSLLDADAARDLPTTLDWLQSLRDQNSRTGVIEQTSFDAVLDDLSARATALALSS